MVPAVNLIETFLSQTFSSIINKFCSKSDSNNIHLFVISLNIF